MLTANPAAMTGLDDKLGTLAVGKAANMVAVDDHGKLIASIRDGELIASTLGCSEKSALR